MAENKKAKVSLRANSTTPTTVDRNKNEKECSEELASIVDTIEEYSDEGFDDEDGEYDEIDKRVRFGVGSIIKLFAPSKTFQFLLFTLTHFSQIFSTNY